MEKFWLCVSEVQTVCKETLISTPLKQINKLPSIRFCIEPTEDPKSNSNNYYLRTTGTKINSIIEHVLNYQLKKMGSATTTT